MNNQYIIEALTLLQDLLGSMTAFFYQKIPQTTYTNNFLQNYEINYNLLLPSSKFIVTLNESQVNAQIQEYINACNALVIYLNLNVETQVSLEYERISNILNTSISQINGFATSLLKNFYNTLYFYVTPYDMSLSYAMYLNNIDLNNYPAQASLNNAIPDFNNIKRNTTITLTKT